MQEETNNIIQLVIAITVIFLIAAAFLILNVNIYNERKKKYIEEKKIMQQAFAQQLLQSQIETQEETFSVLGKELHDNIGQLLNSTKLLIGITQRKLTNYPDTLTIADETLGTAIKELRSLSKSLNKEWLQQFNLIDNLQTEIKRINASEALTIQFTHPNKLPFDSNEQMLLFRIVQEAIQNAIKHAQTTHISIEAKEGNNNQFFITIVNNGKGFATDSKKPNGVGMMNMQDRIKLLNGSINWQSSTLTGTTVTIQLPFKHSTT